MFVEHPGEAGDARRVRLARQNEMVNAEIARRDKEVEITPSERVALRQHDNVRMRIPLDYAAILKHRSLLPDAFIGLPSDEECRRALGIEEPSPAPEPEVQALVDPPSPEAQPEPKSVRTMRKSGGKE